MSVISDVGFWTCMLPAEAENNNVQFSPLRLYLLNFKVNPEEMLR